MTRYPMLDESETSYVLEGKPWPGRVFRAAMAFHAPEGLAAVLDESGAYHLDLTGTPGYSMRFLEAYGFYEGLAAVRDESGWYHIRPDGTPVCGRRFQWCGNFQDGLCAAQDVTGFFHIRADGTDAYPQRYRYVGDFRTALAVAYGVEGAFHIRKDGSRLNSASYRHAEPFHKGLAVAADEHGFFHVDKSGKQVLSLRLAAAEPFYNGVSLCRGKDGGLIRLRRDGTWNRVAESIEPISVPEVRRRLSEGSCVGLFIRHAERQPITPESPNWGNDVPLTDHGEEQSRCLGKELAVGGVRIGLWASPVARSRQTCEALFAGAGGGVPQVLVHHFLGAPGIYLDGTGAHAGPMRADYTAFVAGYLATGGAPGMRPVPEASEQLLAFLEEKMCDYGCTLFVTHDLFAATLMSYLGLKAPDRSDWCDFLEGVCIIRSGTRREYRRFVALERGMPC